MNISNFVFLMLFLWIGGFVASMAIGFVPFAGNPYVAGIFTGVIQILIITVLGFATGKLDFMTILIGGVVCFIGSLLGGLAASMIGFSGIVATILVLAVQAGWLTTFGLIKGQKKVI